MDLGIETALSHAGGTFIDKYRLMKERLLTHEYEHWAAGFPEGNNHGRGHITRVLENLDQLLGPEPLAHISAYELFLAMMSVLYHDIGLLRQRQGHADISKKLLEDDANDAYIINLIDKEIIAAAVVSHSSSKDIKAECSRFSPEEIIGTYRARPMVVAALVRLADELDEDYRRADPLLQQRLGIPPESNFFWLFCQRVRGVRPLLVKKQIDVNMRFEPGDVDMIGPMPGGRMRNFIAFAAEKLEKLNHERIVLNRFLPPELQYSGLHVDVKPLPRHAAWTTPRTFVFNDSTTSEMFLGSFPELHHEPASKAMQQVLQLIKEKRLAEAQEAIDRLASILSDLPKSLQHRVYYEKACVHSICASENPPSPDHKRHLDEAVKSLLEWYRRGEQYAFANEGRTLAAEVHRMASDGDLAFVLDNRRTELQQEISSADWPVGGRRGGGGCVVIGSLIATPTGERPVEELRPGDDVYSLCVGSEAARITTRIAAVSTTRAPLVFCLNQVWTVTPSQPLWSGSGWVAASQVRLHDRVVNGDGRAVEVTEIQRFPAYEEVYELVIDDPQHNYIANGLLCHNKMPFPIDP